jgi:CubicO group peptidase (beta-lactamase class C family)
VISLNQVSNNQLPRDLAQQDTTFRKAFAVLEAGIDQKAFPGATVAVTHRGRLIALRGFGRFTYDAKSPRVTPEIVYDLASLTKVLATTTACMILYERGILRLDDRLAQVLPEFAGSKDGRRSQVTLRMLLAHSSGLPAYAKLFMSAGTKAELSAAAMQVPLAGDPGSRAEYSDIGFILLGLALERITNEPLNEFCEREIFARLGLDFATFRPPFAWLPLIPPSEDDRGFRKRIVRGEVHDENAWVMAGVAGHAGCFATAEAVAVSAECMLRGGAPLLQGHTVGLFTRREVSPAGTSRALGWDTPSPPSQSGRFFSPHSYGHLGYTGTSLWNDPERHLSVTLLTNRTWPDRSSQAIKQIRPAFHDAVIEAIH